MQLRRTQNVDREEKWIGDEIDGILCIVFCCVGYWTGAHSLLNAWNGINKLWVPCSENCIVVNVSHSTGEENAMVWLLLLLNAERNLETFNSFGMNERLNAPFNFAGIQIPLSFAMSLVLSADCVPSVFLCVFDLFAECFAVFREHQFRNKWFR